MGISNILIAILLFSAIILFHELGHFLVAKANKVGVIEFSLGMGPRIISFAKTDKGNRVKFLVLPIILKSMKNSKTIRYILGKFFHLAVLV